MTIDLGTARGVDAQVYGVPGQRTFQLRITGANEATASLWLEKQQIQALSLAFSQVLAQTGGEDAPAIDQPSFPDPPDTEVHVGRMAVGWDPGDKTVVVQVHDLTTDEDADPDVLVRLTGAHVAQLSTRLKEIIAGGRPTCPLCGIVLEPDHTCIRTNGHSSQPIPDRDDDIDDEDDI